MRAAIRASQRAVFSSGFTALRRACKATQNTVQWQHLPTSRETLPMQTTSRRRLSSLRLRASNNRFPLPCFWGRGLGWGPVLLSALLLLLPGCDKTPAVKERPAPSPPAAPPASQPIEGVLFEEVAESVGIAYR